MVRENGNTRTQRNYPRHRSPSGHQHSPHRYSRSPHRRHSPKRSHRSNRSRSTSPPLSHNTAINFPHRTHKLSASHEHSRERERRRRKLQAECIRKAGGFQRLAHSENHETVSLFWDGFQWVAKTGRNNALQNDPALMNSTRKLRRLYFGNLPLHLGLTETGFQDIVWQEMRQRNFCINPEVNPVFYVWFAREKGNYGFVEFATVEETERALTMDGMNCMGIPLKVSRPNDYSTATVTQTQAMAHMGQQAAAMLINPGTNTNDLPSTINSTSSPPPPPGFPPGSTKFMRVVQAILPTEIEAEEDFEYTLDDVTEVLKMHGKIVQSKIITSENADHHQIGDILIEFDTTESLENCFNKMTGRKYLNRPLIMVRIPPFIEVNQEPFH